MTPLMEFLSGSVAAGGFALGLASMAIKGLIILAAAALASLLLQWAPASLRHLCWTLAIAALLVLPIFSMALPTWSVPVLPATTASVEESVPARPPGHETGAQAAEEQTIVSIHGGKTLVISKRASQAQPAQEPITALAPAPAPEKRATPQAAQGPAAIPTANKAAGLSWHAMVFLAWIAGAAFLLLHMLAGTIGIWRIVARARQVTDPVWQDQVDEICDRLAIIRPIQLLRSPLIRVPMTWGILRPVVLLPVGSETWDEERRRCVLAHELAHVKRLDCLTQSVARLACAVHWFNPLVWGALRNMHLEREKACDDYVLRAGRTGATNYASHLIEIARQLPPTFATPVGAVAMARRSQLEGRVLSILEHREERRLHRASAVAAALFAALLILPLAAFHPIPRDVKGLAMSPHVEVDAAISMESHDDLSHVRSPENWDDPLLHSEWQTDPTDELTQLPASLRDSVGLFNLADLVGKGASAYATIATVDVQNVVAMSLKGAGAASLPEPMPRTPAIEAADDAVRRSFNVSSGGTLEIRTTQGNIEVRTGSGSRLDVEVRRTARGRASVEDFDVQFEQRGNTVAVVGERSGGGWRGSDGINVNFIVTVPRDFNLDLDTKGGNIAVADLAGRAKVSTSGGNLSFGEISGTVDAKTSGGNVSVRGSSGNVDVRTSGGNIDLGRIGGTVNVKTSGGNITVEEVNGELQASTSGGQISARMTRQPEGPCRLETSGGGITLMLADNIRADLDAKTSAGRVTSDFDVLVRGEIRKDRLSGKINGGGPALILDTSAGDIRIKRL